MKIAVAIVTSLALVAPALACPNMDHDETAAPKTADKDKKPAEKKQDAAKPEQKPADTAKSKETKDPNNKKPGDKVSLK